MLMHLSPGVAAKVDVLENCRSHSDLQSLKSYSRAVYADMQIAQSCKSYSRADHAVAYAVQSCISRNRADCTVMQITQPRRASCGPAQPRIPRGRVARIARPLTCARPLTHMLPVSLKMLLPPSPSPRLLSSLDELEPSLSDPLLDPLLGPDPEPFELPGIMRP